MPIIVTVGIEEDGDSFDEEKANILQEDKAFSNATFKENLHDSEIEIKEEIIGQNDENRESMDIIKNRIENSLGGIYGKNNNQVVEDEDLLDREIREMRRSATGIVDDLEGLIDRGYQNQYQRTEYLSIHPFVSYNEKESNILPESVNKKITWESTSPSPESEKSNENRSTPAPPSIKIELPFITIPVNVELKADVVEEIQERIENISPMLTDTYDLDSRASSSMSSDSNCSPQFIEQDPEALAKTIEDETFRRYLKISPEDRERLKNREAELPIKFEEFIAIHGFSAENQKLKNEKRNDHISDSITYIDNQHFSYHYEKYSGSSDDKSCIPTKSDVFKSTARLQKNKKRRKKKNEEVIDMDHAIKTLTQEQIEEQRKINRQMREERKKRQAKREKKISKLENHSKKSQEMYEKAERRSKIFSEWMEKQGIITEDVSNLIPRLSEKDFYDEPESSSTKSFFITDVNDSNNYIEKRKVKEKQKQLFAIPQTFDPSNYDKKSKISDIGSVLDQKYSQTKDSTARMPSITRGSNKSVGFLTFWNKGSIPKRPVVRELTNLTSNRDIGNLLSAGVGREHLPKIV